MPPDPAGVVGLLLDRGLTVATGESLTAGLVAATLADVPGCSAVLRGGVVAYQADVKQSLLDVPDAALDRGLVSRAVAEAMAAGAAAAARRRRRHRHHRASPARTRTTASRSGRSGSPSSRPTARCRGS